MTDTTVPLFNPRVQAWYEHLQWSADGTFVLGVTPCERATAEALQMNNAYVVEAQRFWVFAGWHPPLA